MQIKANTVVAIDYTLKDDTGQVIDTSVGKAPLYYLHGHHNIVAGLESALEGRAVGDALEVSVAPEQGYGSKDPKLVMDVPKASLPADLKLQKGAVLNMKMNNGRQLPVTITKVKLKTVEVDGNHALADKTLHFSVTVREIRKATKVELEHGHAHSPDQHHGH